MKDHESGMMTGTSAAVGTMIWNFLNATDFAQPLLDWLYNLRILSSHLNAGKFNLFISLAAFLITGVGGYFFGFGMSKMAKMTSKAMKRKKSAK